MSALVSLVCDDEEVRRLLEELYEKKYGKDCPEMREPWSGEDSDEFHDEIDQFAEYAVEEVSAHENVNGYVTVIYGYKDLAFQARCLESHHSPWFRSLSEAEEWIMENGVW
jgi:hypothetical protein